MFRALLIAFLLLSGSLAMADKTQKDEVYSVKLNGKELSYTVSSVSGDEFTLTNGKVLKGSGNLLITFAKEPDMSSFESLYGVKLLKKGTLWSVFKNESSMNLMALAQKIAQNEGDRIVTVTPDWIMDMKAR